MQDKSKYHFKGINIPEVKSIMKSMLYPTTMSFNGSGCGLNADKMTHCSGYLNQNKEVTL